MKQLVTTCIVFLLLLSSGCSSSKKTASEAMTNSPVVGSWAIEGSDSQVLQLSPSGDAIIDQGNFMTAINRLQNTDRSQYNSRLSNAATYEFNGTDELILNVVGNWTGKGTGARRAADKSVSSTIVFSVEDMGDMIKLTKVSMSQSNSGTDNTNASESLSFTLKKM